MFFSYLLAATLTAPPAPAPVKPGNIVVRPKIGENEAGGNNDLDYDSRKKVKFSFEFSKAEVLDVVKAMSDMTRQNFIIPEKIKGQRITILSPTKITAAEAYQVFYTALSSNGISVVRAGKFYKLVDAKDAIKDTVPTCFDNDEECNLYTEQMVTTLMHLRHTDAGQVTNVVKALLSKDGDVTVFAPNNAMIISEYSPNLKRLRRIIEALDVPGFDDELQLVQIQYSTAAEVAEKITQIFEISKTGTGSSGGGFAAAPHMAPTRAGMPMAPSPSQQQSDDSEVQISKIVPDDRTNQIIIKANLRSFEAIRNLIAKLDVPISETEQGRVHVYYLENAKAEDLSSTLSSLSQGQPTSSKSKTSAPGGPGVPPIPGKPEGAAGASTALFEGDIKITADKATNSLLILSSAHDYRAMRSIIEKLDRPRRQVYVEAAILEINQNETESVGLNFHAPFGVPNSELGPLAAGANGSVPSIGFLQSAQNSSSPSPTFSALASVSSLLGAAGGALGGFFGPTKQLTLGDGSTFQLPTFGIILKWLETSSNTNILSTPHLLTTDNEQAHIEVGNKVPFNTGLFGGVSSALGAAGGAGATGASGALGALGSLGGLGGLGALGGGSVQRIDVSLKLTLTPQINEHNKIRLEIEQTVEDVVNTEARTQTPETAHRAIKTVVVVDDQQTIVLGGLMRDRTSDNETKIPILGDLPILGYLFKQHNNDAKKINLLLILTPYIINSQSDFQRIFERKMQEHEEFAAQYYGHRKEYRAHIDYTKKTGPLGRMVSTLRHERDKYENGGNGDGSEVIIAPVKTQSPASPIGPKPAGSENKSEGEGPSSSSPPPPPSSPPPPPPGGASDVSPHDPPSPSGDTDAGVAKEHIPQVNPFAPAPPLPKDSTTPGDKGD